MIALQKLESFVFWAIVYNSESICWVLLSENWLHAVKEAEVVLIVLSCEQNTKGSGLSLMVQLGL